MLDYYGKTLHDLLFYLPAQIYIQNVSHSKLIFYMIIALNKTNRYIVTILKLYDSLYYHNH